MRLGEVLAALTYALDLAEGQTAGHALRACLIGMTLAERLGLDAERRSELYYAHLLKDAGCSSNSSRVAALLGADDQTVKRALKLTDWTPPPRPPALRARRSSRPRRGRARGCRGWRRSRGGPRRQREFTRLRCERGAEIAAGLGFPPATVGRDPRARRALGRQRPPARAARRGIPLAARIMCLAQTRRRLQHGARRRGRAGGRAPAARPLVRPRAGRPARRRAPARPARGRRRARSRGRRARAARAGR